MFRIRAGFPELLLPGLLMAAIGFCLMPEPCAAQQTGAGSSDYEFYNRFPEEGTAERSSPEPTSSNPDLLLKELRDREQKLLVTGISAASCQKREEDNRQLASEAERLRAESAKLRQELEQAKAAIWEAEKKLKEERSQSFSREGEMLDLKRQLSKTIEDARSCEQSNRGKEESINRLAQAEGELVVLKQQYSAKEKEAKECSLQLETSKQQLLGMAELRRNFLEVQNELAMQKMAESMCRTNERGSKRPESPAANSRMLAGGRAARTPSPVPLPQNLFQSPRPASTLPPAPVKPPAPPQVSDVMTLEVTADKAELRSGPGKENSPIMEVAKGTRLVVEDRQGDWFRIITPTGGRAFVLREVVRVLDEGAKGVKPLSPSAIIHDGAGQYPIPPNLISGPAKAPMRAGAQDISGMEPFGQIKSGNAKPRDAESLAIERLRAMGEKAKAAKENTNSIVPGQ